MTAAVRRFAGAAVWAACAFGALLALIALTRAAPQDLPWTRLDPAQPIGLATGPKLAALANDFGACRELLDLAGVRYQALPAVTAGQCGYEDGVRLLAGGARESRFGPSSPRLACPVAASLSIWEWQVLQPAARRLLGTSIVRIDHYGSYNCRRMYGRASGPLSEHATANAIDVAGFHLEDGSAVDVARDWRGTGPKARFLRAVRDGACRLFATTLSPDYNAAHRDHLHLDQAARGAFGGRACR